MKEKQFFKTVLCTAFSICFFAMHVNTTHGADSQILSVTPPLFQLSIEPGDIWQSSVKVVNGNPYPLTIYAEVVNFEAKGENGQGKFVPILAEPEASTLAHWITIAPGPHVIQPEQTTEVTFFVDVPKDAPPGGHYAAILISTEPPSSAEKFAVKTSQTVTSLFFVRIEGDVEESGSIREFRAIGSLHQRPESDFSLRFENKGNVHLQPRGNIIITNMWGTERGVIPVNYQTHFGNVLPKSIRDFNFTWQSEFNVTDIGRYKAEATLAYGEDNLKSTSAIAYFWVIPIKVTIITLVILSVCIALVVWMIKAYVRRMLTLAGVSVPSKSVVDNENKSEKSETIKLQQKLSYKKVSAPIRSGVLDLRERIHQASEFTELTKTISSFVYTYKIFFISVTLLIIIFVSFVLYIGKATEEHQNYKVIIDQGDTTTTLEGENALPYSE